MVAIILSLTIIKCQCHENMPFIVIKSLSFLSRDLSLFFFFFFFKIWAIRLVTLVEQGHFRRVLARSVLFILSYYVSVWYHKWNNKVTYCEITEKKWYMIDCWFINVQWRIIQKYQGREHVQQYITKIKEMKKNGKPGITTFDCHGW